MTFLGTVKDFVHSITTNDHYASYDASRPRDSSRDRQPLTNDFAQHGPDDRYTQGRRSQQMNASRQPSDAPGIALSDYADGRAVPSPAIAWERIDKWLDSNYPELFDQLLDPATNNDLNEFEHDLDCNLPPDVRESYRIHDGQDISGKPAGIFFGITYLDLEASQAEWTVWRNTAIRLNSRNRMASTSNLAGPSTAGSSSRAARWADQRSVPSDAVQSVYAHPGWVPLAKDFGGNNIAIDLAPGPRGTWGQVILFGREFDTKYVIAPTWGAFLDQFAQDLDNNRAYVDDDIEDAVFAFKKDDGRLASYFEVLKSRCEKQHPRRATPSSSTAGSGRSTPVLISPMHSSANLAVPSEKLARRVAGNNAAGGASTETVLKLNPTKEDLSEAEQGFKDVDLGSANENRPDGETHNDTTLVETDLSDKTGLPPTVLPTEDAVESRVDEPTSLSQDTLQGRDNEASLGGSPEAAPEATPEAEDEAEVNTEQTQTKPKNKTKSSKKKSKK